MFKGSTVEIDLTIVESCDLCSYDFELMEKEENYCRDSSDRYQLYIYTFESPTSPKYLFIKKNHPTSESNFLKFSLRKTTQKSRILK
jgi:hypothetical protein